MNFKAHLLIILICPERVLRFHIHIFIFIFIYTSGEQWIYFMYLSLSIKMCAFINSIIRLQKRIRCTASIANTWYLTLLVFVCVCVYLCRNDYYLLTWFYVKFKFTLERIRPKQLNLIYYIISNQLHQISHFFFSLPLFRIRKDVKI